METNILRDPRQRVVGARETLKKIAQGNAVRVYVATAADPKVVKEVVSSSQAHHVPLYYIDTMVDLGRLCGIQVGAACAAVIPLPETQVKEGG